ncbi:HD-GYP domain-containing protein [Fictibacillus sp. BK138]|uniref:HD-GYP domain-containing protein n=1 Tax=Fictibacillus sp. BK138 TaxID=2512121 RepID=UPI0010293BED|nr:HD-GYP domain-containing protein [Fictibacillus sp. BK138]RZT23410.1 HD-GYP domain-containing protein (c-di-GMP phosphodiesterase class II) [Fictibacillus sp. BK138]
MTIHEQFERRLLKNYVIGSTAAVLGVGGVFLFTTLRFSVKEIFVLCGILVSSCIIMFLLEYLFFRMHTSVFRTYFSKKTPALPLAEKAYFHAHHFPIRTVKRILGPHLFGLSIPAVCLTAAAIYFEYLTLPYYYIYLASLGAILVAGMHAIIEFFLTTKAVQPVLRNIQEKTLKDHGVILSLATSRHISIQRKIQWSTLFIGTFPLLLFALANQVRLYQLDSPVNGSYWSWAFFVLLIGISFAIFGAYLLFKDIQQPMNELQAGMYEVRTGNSNARVDDLYSDEFSKLIKGFNHMARAIQSREHENKQLLESFFATMAATLDARDPYTAGHSLRVADYAMKIGQMAGLPFQQLLQLRKAALLHDIGKIGIPDIVLLKEEKLTPEEFEQIKKHPVIGADILAQVQPFDAMKPLLPGVRYHHERYDGNGYPEQLAGEDIPIFGRIIAVADAYDAMTSDRPYRKGMTHEKALAILEDGKGTQWDPYLTQLFIDEMNLKSIS